VPLPPWSAMTRTASAARVRLASALGQNPGGWVGDHYGRRRAMLLFVSLAAVGYSIVAIAPVWPVVFVGLVFVMCWTSMASPTLFAVVGDALPRERRSVGFSVQAILRRVPVLVAPTLGGLLIGVQMATVILCSLAVVAAHSVTGLVLAFVVGGLREIGEPARKTLILEFVRPDVRARGVGLYYLIRSVTIAPAATVGGLLWKVTPGTALPDGRGDRPCRHNCLCADRRRAPRRLSSTHSHGNDNATAGLTRRP
jgi:MFS family permease